MNIDGGGLRAAAGLSHSAGCGLIRLPLLQLSPAPARPAWSVIRREVAALIFPFLSLLFTSFNVFQGMFSSSMKLWPRTTFCRRAPRLSWREGTGTQLRPQPRPPALTAPAPGLPSASRGRPPSTLSATPHPVPSAGPWLGAPLTGASMHSPLPGGLSCRRGSSELLVASPRWPLISGRCGYLPFTDEETEVPGGYLPLSLAPGW